MILESFAAFLPSVLAGFALVHLIWKNDTLTALGLKLSLGIGLGLGLASGLYFLRLLLLPGQGGFLLIQLLFLTFTVIALSVRKRHHFRSSLQSSSFLSLKVLLGIATLLTAAITLYYLLIVARSTPHGDYDAQAIWNLRARFIYRSGDEWQDAFSPLINRNFHMDYPLLIPLNVVGGWNVLNGEVLRVPTVLSVLFLLGMAGIVYFSISHLRSSSQAAIATALLLTTPALLTFSTFQTADVPLAYFFLAAASLLVLAAHEKDRGLFFLAGMMAGFSAWTKNEGLPFLLLSFLYMLLVYRKHTVRTHLYWLLAGTALPLFFVLLFKTQISVSNDLFVNNGVSEIIAKILTPARYAQIAERLIAELSRLGGWPVSIIVLLFVYGWIMGRYRADITSAAALWILSLSQLMVYLLIYIITPHDLQWHMNYSMDRLLMHIFPMALAAYFLFINTPEYVLAKPTTNQVK